VVRLLLDKGIDPNRQDDSHAATPPIDAAALGLVGILKALLDTPAIRVRRWAPEYGTALMWAAVGNKSKAVQLLLSRTDVDPEGDQSGTAITRIRKGLNGIGPNLYRDATCLALQAHVDAVAGGVIIEACPSNYVPGGAMWEK
jgi:ankyrin repeat protein